LAGRAASGRPAPARVRAGRRRIRARRLGTARGGVAGDRAVPGRARTRRLGYLRPASPVRGRVVPLQRSPARGGCDDRLGRCREPGCGPLVGGRMRLEEAAARPARRRDRPARRSGCRVHAGAGRSTEAGRGTEADRLRRPHADVPRPGRAPRPARPAPDLTGAPGTVCAMTIAHPIATAWLSTGGPPARTTGAQNYDEFADDAEITAIIAANPASPLAVEMPHRAPDRLG